jgi:hypothetical protein
MNRKKTDTNPDGQQTPLTEILAHLSDSAQPISNAELGELSDLSADESSQFEEIWARLDIERKKQILSRLEELTEDNVELNFDRIYRNAIYDIDDDVRREAVEGLWESSAPSILRPLLENGAAGPGSRSQKRRRYRTGKICHAGGTSEALG